MAVLTYRDSNKKITDQKQVAQTLQKIGISFENWGVERLPEHLRSRNLSDAEKQEVLAAFKPEIDRLKAKGGYVTADVVSLYPTTPNIDVMLAKFDKKHLHTEDEIRFCVQGRGVFTIFPEGGGEAIDVELRPGDFISVPAKYHHLFTLCEDKQITCIRLFVDPAGWVAHYVNN
jgi:1,2-dihydroxy-3-keto-5-methylthiopentene dioxygenase